jgi:hypothetical protein
VSTAGRAAGAASIVWRRRNRAGKYAVHGLACPEQIGLGHLCAYQSPCRTACKIVQSLKKLIILTSSLLRLRVRKDRCALPMALITPASAFSMGDMAIAIPSRAPHGSVALLLRP